MKKIKFSDVTLKTSSAKLSFREKIETAKLLDRLEIEALELPLIEKVQVDSLLVKSVVAAVTNTIVTLPVELSVEGVETAYAAIAGAEKARLQVAIPVSPIQMEYVCHLKAPKVLDMANAVIAKACELCSDVEFVALDATRADKEFLKSMIDAAVAAGVKTVTISDDAGLMIPTEFGAFINEVKAMIPEGVAFGVATSNELGMADICAIEAIKAGAELVKVCAYGNSCSDIQSLTHFLVTRPDVCDAEAGVKTTELTRTVDMVTNMNTMVRSSKTPFESGVREGTIDLVGQIGAGDDLATIVSAVKKLGYDLSDEDNANVFEAVKRVTKKKNINAKELDAIVASSALQVPATYELVSYIINSGNTINATAQVELTNDGKTLNGVCIGDGPIDAAFLAIEQIIGRHFELDDFQIQSVTEGREAVGDALIRLRANGKLYSGRGISTDIVGAAIRGYISALNKIVYEEQ